METLTSSILECGVASRALRGQPNSGDLQVVKSFPGGALVAVLDGIGHGQEAAYAATTAGTILEAHARERYVPQLVGEGKSTKEVASLLGISTKTAESHRTRLMQKLDIHHNNLREVFP